MQHSRYVVVALPRSDEHHIVKGNFDHLNSDPINRQRIIEHQMTLCNLACFLMEESKEGDGTKVCRECARKASELKLL